MANHPIILFDGVCNFCNGTVNFIIRHDAKKIFRLAPLQSEAGQKLLRQYNLPPDSLDTMILIENNAAHTRSTAALRILRRLGGIWCAFYIFIVVPAAIRDLVYQFIARHRYRWFGKRELCRVPSQEIRDRFLT